MRYVVSVSLGSSKRDHEVTAAFLGEDFCIKRQGTDGDLARAEELIRELDGKVDAIGLGGIDVYLYAGGERYALRDGLRLLACAKLTPVVDGSGLKNTLERQAVRYLEEEEKLIGPGTKVLLVSAVDRFGMAEALAAAGCDLVCGDLMFAAGIPYPIRGLEELTRMAKKLLPEMTKMPFHMLYPTGKKQEEKAVTAAKFAQFFDEAAVIAGDFHFIRRYSPPRLDGKIILTNTVTAADVEELRAQGVKWLVTTTPELGGRSFGTNVLEAVMVTLLGKRWDEITAQDYTALLARLQLKPRIERLN
ncbi:MAG: quinate 5-dehydrogenase [Clostridia bacterium]|nr:quinate 5-dehydrogenase [Clostridia bacterium]